MDLLAAEGGGNTSTLVTLYVLQLLFGVVVFFTNPKRDDVSDVAQRARNLAIWLGVVPCFGFALAAQVIYIVVYRIALTRSVNQDRALRNGPTGFDNLGDDDPQPPRSPSTNPFL